MTEEKTFTRKEIDELILSFVVNNEPSEDINRLIKILKIKRSALLPEEKT